MRRKFRATGAALVALALLASGGIALADEKAKTVDPKDAAAKSAPEVSVQPIQEVLVTRRPNGSLWNSGGRSLVEDIRASKAGDVLTIIVQEAATASSAAGTKSERSDSAGFGGGTGFLKFLKDFGLSASSSFNGQGQTSRTGALSTRLTVLVKEVLPNGNLRIEGTREVTINKETQKITLLGVVRPQDISLDNTVSSIYLADAAIKFDGKGTVGDRQRKGLIGRILDWIF